MEGPRRTFRARPGPQARGGRDPQRQATRRRYPGRGVVGGAGGRGEGVATDALEIARPARRSRVPLPRQRGQESRQNRGVRLARKGIPVWREWSHGRGSDTGVTRECPWRYTFAPPPRRPPGRPPFAVVEAE